jgi:tetratricopeptide (TPR) repeat protein
MNIKMKTNVTKICEEANEYRKNGEYEKAFAKYEEALKIDAKNQKVYNALGHVFSDIEDYEQAVANFNKAIELNPKFAAAYLNRGRAYFEIGDIDKSLADLSKCLSIAPTFDVAYHIRGRIYSKLGRFGEAIEDFTTAIKTFQNGPIGKFMNVMPFLDSHNVMSYTARGQAYFSISEYEKALEDFNKCITLEPEESHNYYLRGATFDHLDEMKEAVTDLSKAIELNPDSGLYYNYRGNLYANSKKIELAIKDYKMALKFYDKEHDEDNIKECEETIKQMEIKQMELKELQSMYLDLLKEEGYKGKVDEDGDITFKYEGETYLIALYEKDPEFFRLHYGCHWGFKDDGDIIKGLRAVNTINRSRKLVQMHMDGENGLIFVDVEFFVKEPKDVVRYFSRSLGMIQEAIDAFIEEWEKE